MEDLQKSQLKSQALLERVRDLTVEYEDKIANVRVELTSTSQDLQTALQRIEELENEKSAQVSDDVEDGTEPGSK